jgi:phage baseplate assembly protein V
MLQLQRDDQTTSGVGSREASDHARRLANAARYVVVKEVDYKGDTAGFPAVRVELHDGQLLSDWVPWFAPRAGKDRVWDPPEEGEVGMLFSPSGNLGAGVFMPGLFSDGNANGDKAGLQRRTYDDGTVVEYDREEHTLTIDATQSEGTVKIKASKVIVTATDEIKVEPLEEGSNVATRIRASVPVEIISPQLRLNPPQ